MSSFAGAKRWVFTTAVLALVILLSSISGVNASAAVAADQPFGVFVRLGNAPAGSLSAVAAGLEAAIRESSWELLTVHDAGIEEGCRFSARVFVLNGPEYADSILAHGAMAAFAVPVRLAVYEDEGGVHISAVNSESLNRTIISETEFGPQSQALMQNLAELVGGLPGVTAAAEQYGQMRDVGLIAKTMGIMAGGPFPTKVEKIATADTDDVAAVAELLTEGFAELADDWRWGIHPAYQVVFPEHGIAVIGVTSDSVEARSFGIVGEGAEEGRADYACPGVAHAAAYPIELVVARNGDQVDVLLVDVMFRMKMYFEDAGTMAFAANMRMPGSIESEIRDKVEESIH